MVPSEPIKGTAAAEADQRNQAAETVDLQEPAAQAVGYTDLHLTAARTDLHLEGKDVESNAVEPPEPIKEAAAAEADPRKGYAPSASEGAQVDQYVHDQLQQIKKARIELAAEKQAAEQAMDQRRLELERQSQVLVSRLQELHEREQKLSEDLEDALPERVAGYPRRTVSKGEAGSVSEARLDIESLHGQIRDQQMSLELLSAERDAAWAQLQQYRDQQQLIEQLQAERDAALAQADGSAIDVTVEADGLVNELDQLRQQMQALEQEREQLQRERDDALANFQEEPERLKQIEQVKAERDAALAQLRGLTREVEKAAPSDSGWVDLDSPRGELEVMRTQLREQQDQIEQLQRERDDAWDHLEKLPEQYQEQIKQIQGERDAALAQLRQLSEEPEFYAQQEAEFAALRIQVKQEQRQLAEEAQEVHRRETDMQQQQERMTQELAEEQHRLEHLSHQLNELNQQMREDRAQLDLRERELRLRDAQMHLREAEIREMIEIAELDTARERTELNQERLKLARLREAIRLEKAALKAEIEGHGKRMPPLGSDF